MTDEHHDERFKIVRAIHVGTWSGDLDHVTPAFVEEWTTFEKGKVERIVLGLVDSKHVTRIEDDEGVVTLKLTKRGRAWVVRQ